MNRGILTGVTNEEYFRVSDDQRKMYFRESKKYRKGSRFLWILKAKQSFDSIDRQLKQY